MNEVIGLRNGASPPLGLCVATDRKKSHHRVYPRRARALQQVKPAPMPAVAKALTAPLPAKPSNTLTTGRSRYLITKKIPPKVRRAIELFVFEGLDRPDAARAAGITDNWLYQKLKQPEVLKFYQAQCEVLRTGQRHKNLHKAVHIRDTSESGKTAIEAMKFLENDHVNEKAANRPVNVNVTVTPGYICDISKHADKAKQILQLGGKVIEHEE